MGRSRLLHVLEVTKEPLVLVLSLWAVTFAREGMVGGPEVVLALVVFSLTFPSGVRLSRPPMLAVRDTLVSWGMVSGLLFLLGYATRYVDYFYRDTLLTWWWVAAVSLVASHFLLLAAAPAIRKLDGAPRRVLVAGINEPGLELVRRLRGDVYTDLELVGFVDDRAGERLGKAPQGKLLGSIEVADGKVGEGQVRKQSQCHA